MRIGKGVLSTHLSFVSVVSLKAAQRQNPAALNSAMLSSRLSP